jgi:hypothetical protein
VANNIRRIICLPVDLRLILADQFFPWSYKRKVLNKTEIVVVPIDLNVIRRAINVAAKSFDVKQMKDKAVNVVNRDL